MNRLRAGLLASIISVIWGDKLIGKADLSRREALKVAFQGINDYEKSLVTHMIENLLQLPGIKVYGLTEPESFDKRFSTVSIVHSETPSSELAQLLADEGIYVWHGHYYALQFTETLGLDSEGMVRIGLLHYNTLEEVDRLLEGYSTSSFCDRGGLTDA